MSTIFNNRDIRRLFTALGIATIFLLLAGQLIAFSLSSSARSVLYTRDTELAGALLDKGLPAEAVAAVFTRDLTAREGEAGSALLTRAGYTPDTPAAYLSFLSAFRYSSMLSLFSYGLLFTLCVTVLCVLYFRAQQRTITQAETQLKRFMGGNTSARLESDADGSLYKLFADINSLATSLTAHLDTEKKAKAFLKDTLSDISHQLKTPLAALKMYNEILQEDGADPEVLARFTDKVNDSLNRMETLIQNLLKITRLDAGAITLRPVLRPVQAMMEDLSHSFETRARREQKALRFSGSPAARLLYDPDWLTEAVSNLIKNALDHTSTGGWIAVGWDESAAVTRITVQDNGSGIHPEDIHHIFKRFYRSRFSQDTQGAGLGLPLALAITEAHKGTLSVESSPGQGALFTMTFLKMTKL
ncbi:HAMP domain-containing histidine kinase [Eubacterium limosum]|uniref:sensor histidine kinase n=1 Tax=Eubacterium limosum TaxID=1736 RepID=UPI001D07C3A9|nr:HAMP domain-containing sensor histidine kinase [Eubacterium limosum]MCB6571751.1 HAMP domain-containing histidine kinase [Eubacterium limosum]